MRQSEVKPGVRAMLSLGHRGAVAVTVIRPYEGKWLVQDRAMNTFLAHSRGLSPLPVTHASDVVIETTLHRLG
jgi:hypothetical protein